MSSHQEHLRKPSPAPPRATAATPTHRPLPDSQPTADAHLGHRFGDYQITSSAESTPDADTAAPVSENRTGLPDGLKAGVEGLAGFALDDIRVHYNSALPSSVEALAYAQGDDIHLGPGQEEHLAHEAWHVVQQRQGRVPTTGQVQNVALNDDAGLEGEADLMGAQAARTPQPAPSAPAASHAAPTLPAVQRVPDPSATDEGEAEEAEEQEALEEPEAMGEDMTADAGDMSADEGGEVESEGGVEESPEVGDESESEEAESEDEATMEIPAEGHPDEEEVSEEEAFAISGGPPAGHPDAAETEPGVEGAETMAAPPTAVPAPQAAGGPVQRVKIKKGTPFTPATRRLILKANKTANGGFHTCSYCRFQHGKKTYFKVAGKKSVGDGGFHIDHIKPFSKGGQGIVKNGRVLCGTCNTSRGNRKVIKNTGYSKFTGLHGMKKALTLSQKAYLKRKLKYKKLGDSVV